MMLLDDLMALIAGGETLSVEFKSERRESLNDRDLVEAVACLANTSGGCLLIGVEDDRTVTGARPRHGSITDVRRVEAMVANRTVPSCPVEASLVAISGKEVLIIEVPAGRPVTATSSGVYTHRVLDSHGKPQCLPFYQHLQQSREASQGSLDYSALVVPDATGDDLDPIELERLRRTVRANGSRADASLLTLPDNELLRALQLVEAGDRVDRIRVAGLLLLGREAALRRFVPNHEVAFQVMSGLGVQVNDMMRSPLLLVSEALMERFDARNREEEIMIGFVRAGIPDYSRPAFREAVHNALVHRDYTQQGASHVIWRAEDIEVSSPGGFPAGVRIDNLLVAPPRPRNPVLADAFKRIGLVERTGRGIDTIFEGQLRFGRPLPDFSLSTSDHVQLILPGGPANLSLAKFLIERDRPERPVSTDTMLLVNAVDQQRRISVAEAAQLIQKGEGRARAVIERLVEDGVFEARGEGRQRVYRFSAATYRALGRASAHARGDGFEPLQQEQMVLRYTAAHGRITRAQVADLCLLSTDAAKRLLQRLEKRGDLRSAGVGRATYYTLPPAIAGAPEK